MAAIIIGTEPINRGDTPTITWTHVEASNPANDTGEITSVEIWLATAGVAVEVATFVHEGANVLSTRDIEAIGAVAHGSKQTASGLHMTVVTGDHIGIYGTSGTIEMDNAGGTGRWESPTGDDYIPCGSVGFAYYAGAIISLKGLGATLEVGGAGGGSGGVIGGGAAALLL